MKIFLQTGFRTGWSATDQGLNLQHFVDKYDNIRKRTLLMTFFDFKAAISRVGMGMNLENAI